MVNADTITDIKRIQSNFNIIIEITNHRKTDLQEFEINFIKNTIHDSWLTIQQIEENLNL